MTTGHTPMLRCDHCREIVGIYEPVAVLDGPEPRHTSVAAEPSLRTAPGARYHLGCLSAAGVEEPAGRGHNLASTARRVAGTPSIPGRAG
jgi:hypothetical protein